MEFPKDIKCGSRMPTFFFHTPDLLIGVGSIEQIGQAVKEMAATKPLIITDSTIAQLELAQMVQRPLEQVAKDIGWFKEVIPEPPIGVVEQAIEAIRGSQCDLVIGLGGGSCLDTAKIAAALARNTGKVRDYIGKNKVKNAGIPCILVPTTAGSGAEVTSGGVVTDEEDGQKKRISDIKLTAKLAIVDPLLTVSLPPNLTALTGIDALTHAMGGFISVNANPFSDLLCLEAIRLIGNNLRRSVFNGKNDIDARYAMSLAATIGMIGRANSGGGAVHGLSYPLTSVYKLPHAEAISLMLPSVMEYNVVSRLDKFVKIAKAMGKNVEGLPKREAAYKAIEAIKELLVDVGCCNTLKDKGIRKGDFDKFADMVYEHSYRHIENNPRFLTKADIVRVYENAWEVGSNMS